MIACPECGYCADEDEFEDDDADSSDNTEGYTCPACGHEWEE